MKSLRATVQEKLDNGEEVQSLILGCMGQIMEIDRRGFWLTLRGKNERFGYVFLKAGDWKSYTFNKRGDVWYVACRGKWNMTPKRPIEQARFNVKECKKRVRAIQLQLIGCQKELKKLLRKAR